VSAEAARVAAALTDGLRERVVAVEIDEGDTPVVRLRLASGPEIRMGRPTGLGDKVRAAAAVLAALGKTPAQYIDVQVPSAPAVG
jgi:hypothetical protein